MDLLNGLMRINREIDEISEGVKSFLRDSFDVDNFPDRDRYIFSGHADFVENEDRSRQMVFQVPTGTDFFAERLMFTAGVRLITTAPATDGPNEIVHRPALLPTAENVNSSGNDNRIIDFFFSLSETYVDDRGRSVNRDMQNMPVPVALAYSAAVNFKSNDGTRYASFEYPSALVFDEPLYLRAGSSVTVTVAPSLAAPRNATVFADQTLQTDQNEYRVTAYLEGYKEFRK